MLEKFVKECAVLAAFLFMTFIFENYDYFFHYLAHREDYTVVEAQKAYIQSNKGFKSRKVHVYYNGVIDDWVPRDAGDRNRETIRVAYSLPSYMPGKPEVIRAEYVVQTELYVIGILVLILQIRRYFVLRRYCEELTEFPKQKSE